MNQEIRQLIRGYRELEELTGRSRVSLWRDIRAGRFPTPVEVGGNSVAWFADEVAQWQTSLPRRNYSSVPSPSLTAA